MMAGERDFQPAAQCSAVDRSHHGLAAGFEFAEHAMDAHHRLERRFGVCLACARKGCHLVQIGAGAEISGFRAGDDEPFDGGVRYLVRHLAEFGDGCERQHIDRLAGCVPGQGDDAIGILLPFEMDQLHVTPSR